MSSPSCVIIGEGSIALTCLRHLLENGFQVKAVFTNTQELLSLCDQHFIDTFPRRRRIELVTKAKSFDFLFSINNPTILSEAALTLARHLSINYHDSLLPSYAGVHATSWAIIRGERKHGISWHIVEPGIDTGDVLQSQTVEITDKDSAFSLNMKCFAAATASFRRLVSDVQNHNVQHSPQDKNKRSYYGLYQPPPSLGVLDFGQCLNKTYNLARALEFGAHDNRLGSPKIRTPNGKFLLVTKIKVHKDFDVLTGSVGIENNSPPGSVLNLQDNTLLVTAKSGILSINVSELDGRHLLPGQLDKYLVKVGAQLTTVSENVNDVMALLPRKEQLWRHLMKTYEPTTLYIQKLKINACSLDNSVNDIKTVDIPLPKLEFPETSCDFDDFLIAYLIAFLARTNCTSSVHIGLVARTNGINPSYLPMYADVCPGVFKFDLAGHIKDSINDCVECLVRHKEAKTFLLDMFYRYTELREIKRTPHHNLVLGLERDQLNVQQKSAVLVDSNLLLEVGRDKISVSYFMDQNNSHSHVVELLRHFPTFIKSLKLDDSSQTLLDVNLISPTETEVLYSLADHTVGEQSNDIMHLFRQRCASQGEATAIKTTDKKLTYANLLEEVGSLASSISANLPQAYRTDLRCMALHMPNSAAYVVSVLSAIMCNNPFMPVPENTPPERMIFMLKDARVTVMLTTADIIKSGKLKNLSSNLEVLFEVQTSFGHLCMLLLEMNDTKDDQSTQKACTLPEVSSFTSLSDMEEGDPDDVRLEPDCCYVMYTSGSTGRPKGVQVKFSGVFNLALSQIDKWEICPKDIIAQFASIGFDATISEIFTAILSGACLAVLMESERLGREFVDAVHKLEVTIITLPPSVLNIYGPNDFPSLKKVVTAGEACTFSTAMRWTKNSDMRFFNAYGPTETTVCATVFEYCARESKDLSVPSMELPIGKAIEGVQVYLFDDFLKPVPPGVVGEIFIGGRGLSAGYIGHAHKKNDERFIQNPLDCRGKLYKTGDHAIQDKDGCLTYIGRLDDQVKIRGQRIDLNEIEQIIMQHEKLDMAVVVKHQSKTSPDANIAAFVAPNIVFESELREYLARALPSYMIPTYIKRMNAKDFPLTLNGKIDRKKLERDQSIVEQSSNYGSSHLSQTELSIAKIWCQVLQIDETNAYNMHKLSSFSEYGGNSLHMVLLQRTIEEKFNFLLSFTEIGGASSLEDFADLISVNKNPQTSHDEKQFANDIRDQLMSDSILDVQKLAGLAGPCKEALPTEPMNILLSGATGFLGAFLLHEIVKQSQAKVFCMVRETTELRGYHRIVANMKKYKLWEASFESRITVVISDQSKPNMGIAPHIFDSLSLSVDVVFMNAAKMNFNTGYCDHKKANVDGTYEFIKFALTGKRKYLFATSSLAVFLFPPHSKTHQQDTSSRNNWLKSTNRTNIQIMGGKGILARQNITENVKDTTTQNILGNVVKDGFTTQDKIPKRREDTLDVMGNTSKPTVVDIVKTEQPVNIYNERVLLNNERINFNENLNLSVKEPHCFNDEVLAFELNDVIKAKKEKTTNKKRVTYEEADEIQDPSLLVDGYGQSKWVSDKLVLQALNYLPGGAVFRPARVSGHSQTGIGSTNDLFACVIKGITQLGYAPDIDHPYDLTPVDYCASGMVEIMLQMCRGVNGKMPTAYHFFNQLTINFFDLFEGTSVKHEPLEEWRKRIKSADRENPLVPYTPFIFSSFWDRSPDWPGFSTKNTDRYVSSECKKRQPHSRSLLQIYKNFFRENAKI